MVRLVTFGAWLGAAVLLASYAGALHPIGDSFAVFRAQIATGTLLLAVLVLRRTWAATVPGLLALGALALLALPHLTPQEPGPITVYQKNMLWNNEDWDLLAADIRDAAPDALILQEMTDPNFRVVELVADILPNVVRCDGRGGAVGGTLIATRLEVVEGSETCRSTAAAVRVRTDGGEVTLAGVHLQWPWPYGQDWHLRQVVPLLETLDRPVILTGDLNSAAWSHAAAILSDAVGSHPILPPVPSFDLFPLVTVSIDHVFAASGTLERRPLAGSDHYGVLARVTP